MPKNKKAMYIFIALTLLFWAPSFVFIKIAVNYFSPQAIGFIRYLVASAALLVYLIIKKSKLPALRDIPLFLLAGATGFAFYTVLLNYGIQTVSASMSAFIVSASPLITAVLSRFILKEALGVRVWLAIFFAFSGVALMLFGQNGTVSFQLGALWIIAAVILVSFFNIIQRKLLDRYTPLEVTTYSIFSAALLLVFYIPESVTQLMQAPPLQILNVIYLGIFPGAIGYLCYAWAFRHADKTSDVTNFLFISPVITTLTGYFIIQEYPPVTVFIGGVMIMAGMIAIGIINSRKAHKLPVTAANTAD